MRKLIIYVDDDHDDIVLLHEAFSKFPEYELQALQESRLLHQLLEKNIRQVCLIILDINMPLISGVDLLKWLKSQANYKEVPVVMLSTAKNFTDSKIINELGTEIVVKPSSFNEIQTLVTRLIAYC